jgi:hypothetical protein
MKEEWLMPGAFVPVDVETTAALITEIKKLIGVVGGMALNQQRTWDGLTYGEVLSLRKDDPLQFYKAIEAKLKEKNT